MDIQATDRMDDLDVIREINLYVSAIQILTGQLFEISADPERQEEFDSLDVARIATSEKLKTILRNYEQTIRNDIDQREANW